MHRALLRAQLLATVLLLTAACTQIPERESWYPPVREITETPVLSPEESLDSLIVPPNFRVELAAAEPLVEDPIAIDIDPDGRMWVVEMRGFMTDLVDESGDYRPVGRVKVLEDADNDGRMDRQTVFLDSLVLPRSVLVLRDGVLVGEPPHLWLARDTTGDLRADTKTAVREDYGTRMGNPEGMVNSPVWGMDNWIHNTRYPLRFRRDGDSWVADTTLRLGDWGLSMDNVGRFYRNWNSDPLRVELVPSHYYARNEDMLDQSAPAVRIAEEAQEVWPIRTTRGVNRGYREHTLRADGTLRTVTAAGSPVVYRGDRYPAEFQGDVFITEPAGNLVRRFKIIEGSNGTMEAINAYNRAEFMASTDERFRPVNLYAGPDGTLYVIDMYRGVIEHRNFLTQYLRDHVEKRGLETPLGLGRIYRVVHESIPRRETDPHLSDASDQALVEFLSHPSGWWRDTAQQLLIERGASTAASTLREIIRSAENELTRLHALWTLDGLNALDRNTVQRALSDESPHVRTAAVRVSESWLRRGDQKMLDEVTARLEDSSPRVRRQLAASLGEVPPPAADEALAVLLGRWPHQAYLLEAALTGLGGREVAFLEYLLESESWRTDSGAHTEALRMIASTAANGSDPAEIDRMLDLIADAAGRPQWQRLAVLDGIERMLPEPRGDILRPLRLSSELSALEDLSRSSDRLIQKQAARLADRIVWPGKPGYEKPDEPLLTAEEKQRIEHGEIVYQRTCATCHQSNGRGREGVSASLAGSRWVVGRERSVVRIILDGKEGTEELMPAHRDRLSSEEVAAVATYIRQSWGNQAGPVDPATVADVRKATAPRSRPWTDRELELMVH